jgi:hypothetical protein
MLLFLKESSQDTAGTVEGASRSGLQSANCHFYNKKYKQLSEMYHHKFTIINMCTKWNLFFYI